MLSLNSPSQTKPEGKFQGILKPLSLGVRSRFRFGVYDIECPDEHSLTFYCCGFYDGERYWRFMSMADFLCHVMTRAYSGWRFFAHFGGRFDVHYVYDWLRANEPAMPLEINCSGSCVISLTIRSGEHYWRFVDSYRLMEASLATLTHEFNVEHKKLVGRDFKDIEYNENDCRGLYEVLQVFFDEFGICSETIASHALRVFRSHFQSMDLYQPHREVEDFVRESYCGGRCEIYRYDEAMVNHYDVNSLYPTAMLAPLPVRYLFQSRELQDDERRMGFYRATVTQPEIYLPVLPYRFDKLYFPVGKFTGVFTSYELKRAITEGAAVKILEGRIFECEPFLREFTLQLYERKRQAEEEGNLGRRWVVKKSMNGLYGKWGQRRLQRAYVVDDGRPGLYPLPNGIAYFEMESRARHILPHISSAITSRARLMIYDYLSAARNWYTDTDSLFTSDTLPVSDRLGAMKFEGAGSFQAYRLKEYRFAGEYKIKGLPRSKNEDEAKRREEDKRLAELYLAGADVPQERMRGWRESVRRGEPTVARVIVPRHFTLMREKRARDGFDTRPWNVEELIA